MYNSEMFIESRHSFMQRARMIGRRTSDTAKWFVSDISVHKAYGTLTILPRGPELIDAPLACERASSVQCHASHCARSWRLGQVACKDYGST
jgi:hypothetical protein